MQKGALKNQHLFSISKPGRIQKHSINNSICKDFEFAKKHKLDRRTVLQSSLKPMNRDDLSKTNTYPYQVVFLLLLGILSLTLIPNAATAQETDTTRQDLDLELGAPSPQYLRPGFDRPAAGGVMTNMGSYEVPEETEYYEPPFKGQEYLDMAVEAYRKELEKHIGPDWLSKFMSAVSPFINNQFEFGFYQIYDMNSTVDRDNPLFESYTNDDEIP